MPVPRCKNFPSFSTSSMLRPTQGPHRVGPGGAPRLETGGYSQSAVRINRLHHAVRLSQTLLTPVGICQIRGSSCLQSRLCVGVRVVRAATGPQVTLRGGLAANSVAAYFLQEHGAARLTYQLRRLASGSSPLPPEASFGNVVPTLPSEERALQLHQPSG